MAEPVLYVVATPIGNIGDISSRALEILCKVDLIAAEDTRNTGRLLSYFNIKSNLISVHDHNEIARSEFIISQLSAGKSIALVSDAGTPLISDPGYALVKRIREAGFTVTPIPGCCAFIAALSAAGLPTDRFLFLGFLSSKKQSRLKQLHELSDQAHTLVFYESTHRVLASIADMIEVFGESREVVVAREITKKFETFKQGSLAEVLEWMVVDENQQKGEFVILVRGKTPSMKNEQELDSSTLNLLQRLSVELPPKKASAIVSEVTGINKKLLYEYLLKRNTR